MSEMNQSYTVWEAPTRIPLGFTGRLNVLLKLSKRQKQRFFSVHRVPALRRAERYRS